MCTSTETLAKAEAAPFVHAPVDCSQDPKAALHSPRATTLPRPPHPIPTFVTMANAPLSGQDGEDKPVIWVKGERKYF